MKKPRENINALLNSTKGALTKEQIAIGMHFCYCNASDLFQDASILLKNHKFARAFGLCVLCLEELAKIPLLCNGVLLKGKGAAVWVKFWNALSSHKLKQNIWSVYGKTFLPEARKERYYKYSYPKTLPALEKLKQLSFYVDFFCGNAVRPQILFGRWKGLVGLVFRMAEDRLEAFRPLHSKPALSSRVVELTSKTKIKGISEKQLEEMLFESIQAIKTYHESGPSLLSRGRQGKKRRGI